MLERQCEVWRRERVKRSLDDARATLVRGVHKPPTDVPGKTENGHVAPEAPSSADSLRRREVTPLPNLREPQPKPEPPERERGLDTAPIDWNGRIAAAFAAEREYQHELLAHLIADIRAETSDDLKIATRSLAAEVADLRAKFAELRLALADERGKAIDLPNPLRSHRAN